MTREEAIKNIKEHCYFANLIPQAKEALDIAIEALEQEPKSEWQKDHEILKAYSDGANGVLDELRAEIEMYEADCRLQGGTDECEKCNSNVFGSIYRIIDKYKAESEVEE